MPAFVYPFGADLTPRKPVPHRPHHQTRFYDTSVIERGPLNSHVIANMKQRVTERRRALGFEGKMRTTVDKNMKRGFLPGWWSHAVPGEGGAANAALEGQF